MSKVFCNLVGLFNDIWWANALASEQLVEMRGKATPEMVVVAHSMEVYTLIFSMGIQVCFDVASNHNVISGLYVFSQIHTTFWSRMVHEKSQLCSVY